MYLYNIHCHKIETNESSSYPIVNILSTTPENYYEEKKLIYGNNMLSCGIHPWYLSNIEDQLKDLKKITDNEQIIAIGEAGLDKVKNDDLSLQTNVFRYQIELAEQLQKPLIIHCVKAWVELIALYKEYKPKNSWIIHGYRGNPELTKQLVKTGLKFSIGEKYNKDSLYYIPLHSIFCESDNSKISICQIYQQISTDLGLNLDQFIRIVNENFKKNVLFHTQKI